MGAKIEPCWLYFTRDADGFARDVRKELVEREAKSGEFKVWSPTGDYDKNTLHTTEALAKRATEAELQRPATVADLKALEERIMLAGTDKR